MCTLKSVFLWDALLNVCFEHLFEQLLKIYLNNLWIKKSNVPYVEISQNFFDVLFSSIKQFTLGYRIILLLLLQNYKERGKQPELMTVQYRINGQRGEDFNTLKGRNNCEINFCGIYFRDLPP